MTLEEYTKERILEDVTKLQYLYKLKDVIRYDQERKDIDVTESVAEHLYGMCLLTQYFLPLENHEGNWDKARIYEMITCHDFDEIETGDIISWKKTTEDKAEEVLANETVIKKSPLHMQAFITKRLSEYEGQESAEAKFVRAIDKIEPYIHVFKDKNRPLFTLNKCEAEDSIRIKEPYVSAFPFIRKCSYTIHEELIRQGYFWTEGK